MKLTCEKRSDKKKNASRRLRNQGIIPANYILDGKPQLVSVIEKEFVHLLNTGLRQSSLIDLSYEGQSNPVVVKEIQRHPVNGSLLHIDFFSAGSDAKIKVKIAIELDGIAKGVKRGGALEHYIRHITVKSKPSDLQDVIKVDISDLDVDDSIYFKDLKLNDNWDIRITGNPIIARVAKSRLSAAGSTDESGDKAAEEKK